MDKGDRNRLFTVMEALPQIEEWRMRLTLTERLSLNHPSAVLRKFKAAFEVPERDDDAPKKPTLRDSVATLDEENTALKAERKQLQAHVAELQAAAGSTLPPTFATAREVYVKSIMARDKAERVAEIKRLMAELDIRRL